jgi:hypothetical protein
METPGQISPEIDNGLKILHFRAALLIPERGTIRSKPQRGVWIGRSASALLVSALLVDGAMQLFAPAKIASMTQETGFAMDLTPTLGGIMVACAVLYAIPVTTVLSAILVTGFLGGAICAMSASVNWDNLRKSYPCF